MKLKIRKVEATKEQFYEALKEVIESFEYSHGWGFIFLSVTLKEMGLKETEFFTFVRNNEDEFNGKFSLYKPKNSGEYVISLKGKKITIDIDVNRS